MSKYIIEMQNIEKSYGVNKVLKGVDFQLKKGEIHALLGENGTGKTTLMNILGGVIDYDAGNILYDGEEVKHTHHGTNMLQDKISFVHQELALLPDLTVAENLFFGQEIKHKGILDNKKMREESAKILQQLDVNIDPNVKIGTLDASYQQVIEISKGLMKESKVLILDEPTSSLTENEIDQLFKVLNNLRDKGLAIIFISHKLNEVLTLCDSFTVLRDGEVVKSKEVSKGIKEYDLAKYMIGKDVDSSDIYHERKLGDVILETKKLSRDREFKDVDINIRKGEIVGVTGLLGDGRSELFETIYGNKQAYEGSVLLEGEEIKCNSTVKSIKRKIAYVPRNRKINGIIKDLSISDNMNMTNYERSSKAGILNRSAIKNNNEKFKDKLNIKLAKFSDLITKLSGGNQQKVMIGRALSIDPKIVILDNPTQGVDVGAKFEIYTHIMNLADEGISFFVLSSEASEIMMICDRAYVMFHGEIRDELKREAFNEERIMTIATGGINEK
ncbi:ribose transport system ATP-binding protein [Breznakia sp. PF5-3]|uniref:sugar ABC transporter ATP-binding protein n=1 Tax=unclassified Breznakia TaxID=2623764 RepID=UPI002405E4C3|nr:MULTISPECIES: sugar ABC transporter ATP-binding protein [unclassified Breznakia]MDF9824840.1 ribose transport system ATP-binding protein [Breznakia sp. PM6-1]MDF9835198.1 ribose transport system ATP-binding protein [Breznakia sp. PF5-3]MDF9837310.1 ribose transport system ATP-binding protein [Breznakia sp. PFB2-8]MDF9859766.1 ribose transport system ATP-binding protein [Breznakia sp. PH5-24]